jgi:hypothetical protein
MDEKVTLWMKRPNFAAKVMENKKYQPQAWGICGSPDSVWCAHILLLFSASAATDTG